MATKSKGLKIGDAVTIRDRLWCVLSVHGSVDTLSGRPMIYHRRSDAQSEAAPGSHILRLRDIIGDVVR